MLDIEPVGGARWGSGGGGVGGGLDNPIQLVQRFRGVKHHGSALPLPGPPLHHGDGHGGGGAEHLVPGWGRWVGEGHLGVQVREVGEEGKEEKEGEEGEAG